MKKLLNLSAMWYDDDDPLGAVMALLGLIPILIVTSEAVLAATTTSTTHSMSYFLLFLGQLANEMLNLLVKGMLRIPRPITAPSTDYGMPSSHGQFIGFFLGAWPVLQGTGRLPGMASILPVWMVVFLAWIGGLLVCYSRWHLGYHSPDQIVIGLMLGLTIGSVYKSTIRTLVRLKT